MHWFLKCFYGFQNLGDEMLFWWVLDYIDTAYGDVDELTVEVDNVAWMEERWTKNVDMMIQLKLASWFVSQKKIIKFTTISKNILDNFHYDFYFFGWGEVFAESRWFHGGWNYLFRYLYPILRKKFILLGGIETATTWRQKLLYKIVLPRAQRVVTRDHTSFDEVKHYTDKAIHHYDFAIPVIDRYRQNMSGRSLQTFAITKPYVIVNIVQSMSSEELYQKIKIFLTELYPNCTPVYLAGKSINSNDTIFAQWLEWAYPHLRVFQREEYSLSELLALIDGASAWFASRLHILLLLQEFEKPLYSAVYAEKVKKLITSTIEL